MAISQGMAEVQLELSHLSLLDLETGADPDLPASRAHRHTVPAWKAALSGLTSGARIWVRVRAIGTGGTKGPWSDPAVKAVPSGAGRDAFHRDPFFQKIWAAVERVPTD